MTAARATAPGQRKQMQTTAARERAMRRRSLLYGVLITALGTLLALFQLPVFVIVFGGLMPTFVVYFIDEQKGRYLFRTVAVMNLAGVIPFVESAWHLNSSFGLVGYPISSLETWITMYGSAVAGFILAWLAPMIVGIVLDANHRSKMQRCEAERRRLAHEWDLDASESEKSAGKSKED